MLGASKKMSICDTTIRQYAYMPLNEHDSRITNINKDLTVFLNGLRPY